MGFSFEVPFEFGEESQAALLVFADPAVGDFMDRDGIQEMELLAATPQADDKIGRFENFQVLGDGLARHFESLAQFAERLAVLRPQAIEQLPATGVGEGLEHFVHVCVHTLIMQPNGCMSRGLIEQVYVQLSLFSQPD
jgi:hypothetical protein